MRFSKFAGTALILSALVLTLTWGTAFPARAGELTLTFIGNESFHITDGETTLLTDFPYQAGYMGYMSYDMAELPPVEDGLSLITHFHKDHWDRALFEQHPEWSIVAAPGILDTIESDKEIPIEPVIRFKDLTIQPDATPHNFSPQHYSFLVTWHGKRLYFVGDTETPAYILPLEDIDVLFITPWLIRTIARQELSLDADKLIVYHHKTDEEIPPFQDYLRMEQGASITLEFDDAETGEAEVIPLPTPVPAPVDMSGPQPKEPATAEPVGAAAD
jgi:L-ascorbate metabolism protein UlaG (beta-lactamase superfamily)